MKVTELRDLLKQYEEDDLRLIIVEMYKSMPKNLREEKDTDSLVKDIQKVVQNRKAAKEPELVDVYRLKAQIELFIDYAYKQYYFAPNSYVHKKDRPKWRFMVKSFIKDLQQVPPDSPEGDIATDLLEKLFDMLCYGTHYYIFSTEDPFRSIGMEREELFDLVVSGKLRKGIKPEFIHSIVKSIVDNRYCAMINVLISNLKTPDARMMTIEQCILLKKELDLVKPVRKSNSQYVYDEKQDKWVKKVNRLVNIIVRTYMALCEYDEAIKYFKTFFIGKDKEVVLYHVLDLLQSYEMKDLWLREYDEAVSKGVEPRKSINMTRKALLEKGTFPESIYIFYDV